MVVRTFSCFGLQFGWYGQAFLTGQIGLRCTAPSGRGTSPSFPYHLNQNQSIRYQTLSLHIHTHLKRLLLTHLPRHTRHLTTSYSLVRRVVQQERRVCTRSALKWGECIVLVSPLWAWRGCRIWGWSSHIRFGVARANMEKSR